MSEVELLADRFAAADATYAVDLATGDPIVLTIASAGGPSDQHRWAVRCDTFMRLRHRSIAPLVDYGGFGATQRFEAWRCGPPWRGSHTARERAVRYATKFLHACGLTTGKVEGASVRESLNDPVVLPNAEAGYPLADEPNGQPSALTNVIDDCGLSVGSHPLVSTIEELLASADPRPQVSALWGEPGIGKSTILLEAARLARVRGKVPVSVAIFDRREFRPLLAGRTLLLIADDAPHAWQVLLAATLGTPKPHILILAGDEEVAGIHGVHIDRLSVAALMSSVQPTSLSRTLGERVARAARHSGGFPGRFVTTLWPATHATRRASGSQRWLRVAEQPAAYGVDEADEPHEPTRHVAHHAWPIPGELNVLRRRVDTARELLDRGRHAPGERLLRQAIGGLERRGDYTHAAEASLALGSSLLKRGHANDARAAIMQAGNHSDRVHDEPALVHAAILAGAASIDLGRLDEAESVLGAALARARASRDGSEARISGALARCAFWGGRYADAQQLVERASDEDDRSTVRARVLRARISVGLRDLASAISLSIDSLARARAIGDTSLIAAAACAAAFAHLATGDLDACERDAAECTAAANAAHEPLRAIRARLLVAESLRRRGRPSAAASILRRLAGVGLASLPPIVRARVALLQDLSAGIPPADAVAKHVRTTGLHALALFVPAPSNSSHGVDEALSHVLEILQLCQAADDETSVLAEVSGRLRRQLHAAAAGFIVRAGGCLETLASDGRLHVDVALRAIDAGVVIPPHQCADRIEAAAPVRYGGTAIGAVVARWTLGSTIDHPHAPGILSAAATAIAPVMAAALAHRARPPTTGSDLIGVSAAIDDVRLAIDRAARAPFPVLVVGESGSGKELVARALHRCGTRREKPFCTLNCAALPDDLVEAELFGHARGAFTGATAERAGVFEEAHTGTLFLDEIGELSLRAQAKVLRVVQEGELKRIGENMPRHVDVRLVAATNRDLHVEAAASRFRMDLLYRLDVIRIVVPALRDRREDIAPLAEHFWREAAQRVGSRATIGAATIAALARYDWPGNVRELQNVLAALVVRTPKRGVVSPSALPPALTGTQTPDTWRLGDARRTFEQRFVRAALARSGGHRSRAASELGVTRQGLTKLMTRLGIE